MMVKKIINGMRIRKLRKQKPHVIIKSLQERQGYCKKCGKCCYDCLLLHKEETGVATCTIWDDIDKRMALGCRVFPIDAIDKQVHNPDCAYYWKKKSAGVEGTK